MASRPLIAAAVGLLTALSSAAAPDAPAVPVSQPDKLAGLLANSPFGSARAGATAGGAAEPLEFRAVLEENGNRIFAIYDPATRQSSWVELNDPVKDFSVKEFDAATNGLTVEYQGKPLKLALKRAPAVQMAAPPGTAAPPPNRNMNMQVAQTPVAPQQLQQIRDEINRRRALRAQPAPATPVTNTITIPPPARP